MNPKIDIIVTRHEHLVTVLHERGVVTDTPILTHASASDIAGKHVIGVLPHHLSERAATVTEVPMRWTEADRVAMQLGDVDLEHTRQAAGDSITYVVHKLRGGGIDPGRPRWLAMAKAYEHVEHHGYHFGAGPFTGSGEAQLFRGLPVTFIYDSTQQVSAEVIESRGVWRPECRGPWLDGYGLPVADSDIAPASGWTEAASDQSAVPITLG